MQNLFRLLLRYHLFLLFVVLEIFCFYLIYSNNSFNHSAYLNVANGISGKVYTTVQNTQDYFYLKNINDSLVAENAALRSQLMESKLDYQFDSATVRDSAKRFVQNYTYITARVTHNSVNRPSNYIYLDKGKISGIDKEMGVISPMGIVGQVVSVTENYAAVMSVLSKDFRVSAKFRKNDYFGNLHWNGNNTTLATLEEIPKHVPVNIGDTLVTSGFSELFPRHILIGIVKTVHAEPEKSFQDITVNLSTDFGNLSYVYVVKDLYREEIRVLDSLTVNKKIQP